MASSILSLPANIVGQIVGFNTSSHYSLNLWLVGNLQLQSLLASGVQNVELQNFQEYAVARLPKYLTNLSSLRHLVVDRQRSGTPNYIYDHANTMSIVQGLPIALESIIFRFCPSSTIFFPSNPASTPHISINATFPALQRLALDHSPWLAAHSFQLPPTITELAIDLPRGKGQVVSLFKALPPILRKLHVTYDPDINLRLVDFIPLIPEELESILIINYVYRSETTWMGSTKLEDAHTRRLPRSLIHFAIVPTYVPRRGYNAISEAFDELTPQDSLEVTWSHESANTVPPFIASLNIDVLLGEPESALPSLHANLRSLQLPSHVLLEVEHIKLLPRHLTTLRAAFKHFKGLQASDFPPPLRSLTITAAKKSFSLAPLDLLPNLTFLECIPTASDKMVATIPSALKHLRMSVDDEKDDHPFPSTLRSLHFERKFSTIEAEVKPKKFKKLKLPSDDAHPISTILETFRLTRLPDGLTQLTFSSCPIPMSDLQHLPSSLTDLDLSYIWNDGRFNPTDPALFAKARRLLALSDSLEDQEYDFDVFGDPPQVTICDLLPRSIVLLRLCGSLNIPVEAWSRLPPNLTFLGLVPTNDIPLKQSVLQHIPMTRLCGLHIYLDNLDDRHVALLPKRHFPMQIITAASPSFTRRSFHNPSAIQHLMEVQRLIDPSLWEQWRGRKKAFDDAQTSLSLKQMKFLTSEL